jgi:outer membrane protein OmpA-like peptidoglycan-associated protein
MSNQQPIDRERSTLWAIADVTSLGFVAAGFSTYDLYNRMTGRAHSLHVVVGGFGFGLPAHGSLSMNFDVDYNYFTTKRPVNFDDFNLRGADVAGINAVVYSATHLNVYDGPNLLGTPRLLSENFTSWGVGLPSLDVMWGVTKLEYGAFGLPRGTPQLKPPDIGLPVTPENLDMNIRMTQQDDAIVLRIPNIVMFDFDKADIKPHGVTVLTQVAQIIRKSPTLRSVEIEGHTDSIGSPGYNMDLSLRRAGAVTKFLKARTFMWKQARFKPPVGRGLTRPLAPNDNEAGRQLNRRVEIYLWYR